MDNRVFKLKISDNFEVYYLRREKFPIFYTNLLIDKGSVHEKGKRGIHNFTLKLINEGPVGKSPVDFSQELERMGLRLKVRSGYSISTFESDGLSDFFSDSITKLSEIMTAPAFRGEDFKRLKDQYVTAIQLGFQDPEFIASYFSNYFYFQNVPELRALPDFGLIPDVLSLELNEIKDFYAGLLGKTRIRVVVVSNLDLQERIQDFEVLKDVRSAEFTLVNLWESYPKFDKIYFVDMDIEQAHIRVIAPSIPRSHPSYQHLKVANFIFGGSDLSSRLMKRLRVKEALTYSASSSINVGIPLNGNIVGAYKVIACETNKRNVRRAFDLIFDELSKVHEEGFSEEELQDAVSFFKGNTPLKMESYAQLLSMITEEVIYELPYFHFEEEVNEIKGIKIQELNDVALRFFNFDHPFILIVGKASTLKEYFTDLEAEFIDPMEYIKG